LDSNVSKSAVVTGAASGIGRAIAIRLAREGFDVVVADVRRTPITGGDPTVDVIAGEGGSAVHADADVSQPSTCAELIEMALSRTGSLDVVVNNAAIAGAHSKPLLDTEEEDWDAIMAVNLRGPYLLCRLAVRQMLTQEPIDEVRGRIINITSQHGMVGAPGAFTYSVSKGGLAQMTRQIAVEHGRDGILCNAVAPGKIVTGTPGDLSTTEEGLAYVSSRTPFFRLGQPDDVAGAVTFLATTASYVSGVNLLVDGGWMAY
jgi:NAD(P)-dependent dehydrogenase (short-subunit alcohol dehydrogenase family)